MRLLLRFNYPKYDSLCGVIQLHILTVSIQCDSTITFSDTRNNVKMMV